MRRKLMLERQMAGMSENKKQDLRRALEDEENKIAKETRKRMCPADFESLAVIGRGAFGEVRLVRRRGKKEDPATGQIFALKSMKKEMMVVKNQVHHVKAERDALAKADSENQWLTVLHYSFIDETHLYMVRCMLYNHAWALTSSTYYFLIWRRWSFCRAVI
jgi:serine/threonine kinase 38